MQSAGGDEALLADLLTAFLQECPAMLEQSLAAYQKGDAATLRRAAHTLKGSLRYLGAGAAAQLATELESAAQHTELALVVKLLPRLESEVRPLLADVRRYLSRATATVADPDTLSLRKASGLKPR